MSNVANKAVFLSYASQDAEAAKRICESLRQAGVEVWFDQSELRGGDAWDAKIRKQIKECALFVPVISANTQARQEGYFRLEWRLADQRTHLMSHDRAFVVPVVVDETTESGARVPESFVAVQWSRLIGGDAPPAFCERVNALLLKKADGDIAAPSCNQPPAKAAGRRGPLSASTHLLRSGVIGLILVTAVALAIWHPWAASPHGRRGGSPSENAGDEIARLRARLIPDQWKKEDFEPWSAALDKIIAADDQNSDAWALRSIINSLQVMRNYEASTKPLATGLSAATRAALLAPNSALAELALGMHYSAMVSRGADVQTAWPHLRKAFERLPRDALTCYAELATAYLSYDFAEVDRAARAWLQREPDARFPAFILGQSNLATRKPPESVLWAERGSSDQDITGTRAFVTVIDAQYYLRADLHAARMLADLIPSGVRGSHRVLHARWLLAMAERRWDVALKELASTPESIFYEGTFYGPKALLAGFAHLAAGRADAALSEFHEAERVLRDQLANDAQNEALHAMLALTLGYAGGGADAKRELALVEPLIRGRPRTMFTGRVLVALAQTHGVLGQIDAAAFWLRELLSGPSSIPFTPASLRIDPRFQNIIGKPEVQALLAEFAHLDVPTARFPSTPVNTSAVDPKSIAVLPFENLNGEGDAMGFTDGMHEEVLTALAKVAALKVIGRTSVLPYRESAKRDLRKIAADLSVGSVVEGTVQRAGNRVRIRVKLVDTQNSQQLWGNSFEEDLTDVFAIQVKIAQEVASTLRATLTAGERATLERRPTTNTRAYELYLQAKVLDYELNNTSPLKDWERVVQLLEQAVAADPKFAQAHALLARTHASMSWHGSLDPSPARRELARKALGAAQRLAPTAAETHFAEGRFAYTTNREFSMAMTHFEAALVELPNDSALLYHIGLTHRQLGDLVAGSAAMMRAHELNPLDISNVGDLVITLLSLRRFEEAVRIGTRYPGASPELRTIAMGTAIARYELTGDRTRLALDFENLPFFGTHDPDGLYTAYQTAYRAGDVRAAAGALMDSRLMEFPGLQNAMSDPVALYRAMIAKLLHQDEDAVRYAGEAERLLRSRPSSLRQQPFVALGLLRAAAYAGRNAEVLRQASELRRQLAAKKGVDEISILDEVGRVYALVGAKEEALALLHMLMTGPNSPHAGTPRMVRLDPCWSRLADDPRFEEYLQAAKPL